MPTDQKSLTQHDVRRIVVQFLYSKVVRPEQPDSELLAYILDGRSFSQKNLEFFYRLIKGVNDNKEAIDQTLAKFLLKTWSVDRITTIDHCVAWIGAYEILYSELPNRIAIDEAINLAKDFSDETAAKLINGLLTNLIKEGEF
jgi:N utilization substance protein B